ncbi:helix-turn-helix transcriptional regulator [Glaciihabitans sp. dw_435]|uniref:helix-turn-helix transcriptional regulator n=1 Tax=Glaciihabitans sp. dw_435 TaxID=2720081 RepID=UPI001BD2117B|nr:helix-turn-helix transcriptional regulator [Glaciihabitans sp. dw_435]
MDNRSELREFLASRRANITPTQANLPAYGGNRRVPGLRREEVAMLAGVSVDYYTKLERGNVGVVSDGVLDAVARALHLTDAERDHLFRLAGSSGATRPVRRDPSRNIVRPAVQRVVDAIVDSPAFVRTHTRQLITANALGRAVYSPLYDADPAGTPNTARFLFLNAEARTFFTEWAKNAADMVANLRTELGRDPYDRDLTDLIDDLNRDSVEFRTLWKAHDVRYHDSGIKRVRHPVVGELELTFEAMELPADPGQSLIVYGAEPGSPTADALRLLASWAADPRPNTASNEQPHSAEID